MSFYEIRDRLIASAKEKAKDGLTGQELGLLVYEAIEVLVSEAKKLPWTGAFKKEEVMNSVALLFDQVAPMIPVPIWYPSWLLRPHMRRFVLWMADGLVEAIYKRLK